MSPAWWWTPDDAEAYVRAAAPRLLRFARRLTLQDADAEDLLQDTLVDLLVHWSKVSRADDPDRYARRVMVNRFLSHRRRAESRTVPSDAAVAAFGAMSPAPDDAVGGRLLADSLLATLDPRSRAVLVLRYVEDLPDAEVAAVVGISVGNVRVVAHRALARLRPALADDPLDAR